MKTQRSFSALSLEELERLEGMCGRLENAQTKEDRNIELLVDGVNEQVRKFFVWELLWQDIEQRQIDGQTPTLADYSFTRKDDNEIVKEVFKEIQQDSAFATLSHEVQTSSELPSRYKKVDEIGRGGIGSVWRVEDTKSQRPLAVKTLRQKFRADRQANLRLEREAILTGMLQHPGIPPVHNHGYLNDSSVFFAMKLVDGKTLEQILNERGNDDADTQKVIGIFEKVTQTMAYVHSQGVIHRDLKPQNIMVGKFAEVQVMDWGMAKRLNSTPPTLDAALSENDLQSTNSNQIKPRDTTPLLEQNRDTVNLGDASSVRVNDDGLTRIGDVLGTPAYMAPEQARGELDRLDARSDVYALGAILFEILTRERIFAGESTPMILQKVSAGDLKQILLKLDACSVDPKLIELCKRCLSHVMSHRPKNATEVANALTDHFASAQKRIKAAEIELREAEVRTLEETKRRKTFARMLALVAAVFTVGLAGVIWQWNKAEIAGEAARKNAVDFKKAAEEATANENNYREGLTVFSNAFQSVTPGMGADSKMSAKDVLVQARNSLGESKLDGNGKRSLLRRLSNCFSSVGENELAIDVAEELFELCQSELGAKHIQTLESMTDLGFMYREAGRLNDSMQILKNAYKVQEEILGDDHPHTLDTMSHLGIGFKKLGNYNEALKYQEKVLNVQLARDGETDRNVLRAMTNLGDVYLELGQFEESVAYYERALEGKKTEFGFDDPDTVLSMNSLANLYSKTGRTGDAMKLLEEVVDINTDKLGRNHPRTLISLNNLAGTYQRLGKFHEAAELFEEAIESGKVTFGKRHPNIVAMMNNRGSLLESLGRHEEAATLIEEAMEIFVDRLGDEHPNLCYIQDSLASSYLSLGRFADAVELLEKSLELSREKLGDDHPRTMTTMHSLANCYFLTHKTDDAAKTYEETLKRRRDKLGLQNGETLQTMSELAFVYESSGKLEKAKSLLKTCLPVRQDIQPKVWQTFDTQSQYGGVLLQLDQIDEASKHINEGYLGLAKYASKMNAYNRSIRLRRAVKRLIDLAETRNDSADAVKWQAKLDLLADP